MDRVRRLAPFAVVAFTVLWALPPVISFAQQPGPIRLGKVIVLPRPGGGPAGATVSFPQDRNTMRKLKIAQKQVEEKNYSEAVRILGSILESSQDFFFKPKPESTTYSSVKAETRRLIGGLPPEGLRLYETRYGTPAQKLLDEALRDGNLDKIKFVAGRYFHTQAGYKAMALLGDHSYDQGQYLGAALCYSRLSESSPGVRNALEPMLSVKTATCWLRAGLAKKAGDTLLALKQSKPGATLNLGERSVGLFARGADPLVWLRQNVGTEMAPISQLARQWLLVRGGPARNAQSGSNHTKLVHAGRGEKTVDGVKQQHPEESPAASGGVKCFDHFIEQVRREFQQRNVATVPATQPLIVGDTVVARTVSKLVGFDLQTGRRRWEAMQDFDAHTKLRKWQSDASATDATRRNAAAQQEALLKNGVMRRLWNDNTYGSLSSDGERVFCVDYLPFAPITYNYPYRRGLRVPVPVGGQVKSHNQLTAYSVHRQGARVWELGGGKGEVELDLAGTFFLGAPLPLAGRVYAIAEIQGQICLVTVDARHGTVLGKPQPLCDVEQRIEHDPLRQICGASPSYANGILVCPTGAGAVVAVDLLSRSLLWGYTYPRDNYASGYQPNPWGRRIPVPQPGSNFSRWADTSVILAEGKALVTPVSSKSLHCLNLLDGSPAWEKPLDRGDGLFVGCVHKGRALLVGTNSVRVIDLGDGKQLRTSSAFPGNARPSGRGFHHDGTYCLPLTSGKLLSIDVETAQFGEAKPIGTSQGGKFNPGNLAAAGGYVASQDLLDVNTFRQISRPQILGQLKINPNDVDSLILLGELALQDKDLAVAVPNLRRAVELSAKPKARKLLIRALLAGMRADFAKYRSMSAELERLVADPLLKEDGPKLRAEYLRTLADSLYRAKEHLAALQVYLKLEDVDPSQAELQSVEEGKWSVRHDRWVQTQLQKLRGDASAEDRAKMDEVVLARLKLSDKDLSDDSLRTLLRYFGYHPSADELRQRLVDRLIKADDPPVLELEILLRALERSKDPKRSAQSVAQLAYLYEEAGLWSEAADYYQRLRDEFADVVCRDGKTGRQLFECLAGGSAYNIKSKLTPREWPTGKVKVDSSAVNRTNLSTVRVDTPVTEHPFYRGLMFQIENRQSLVARTPWGERWRTRLISPTTRAVMPSVAYGHRLGAYGHLVVLSTGYHLYGIDAAGTYTKNPGDVLWVKPLTETFPGVTNQALVPQLRTQTLAWGGTSVRFDSRFGKTLGSLAPLVTSQVTFLRGNDLISLDALTGGILWIRHDVSPGGDVLGDEDLVIVAQPDGNARAFHAADGSDAGPRVIPALDKRMAVMGTRVLSWEPEVGRIKMKMHDVAAGNVLWEKNWDASAKSTVLGTDEVAVYQMDDFRVLSLADGETRFGTPIGDIRKAAEIHVIRGPRSYVLAVSTVSSSQTQIRLPNGANVRRPNTAGMHDIPIIVGHVYGYNTKDHKLKWSIKTDGVGLPLNQPSDSPAATFVTWGYVQQVINGRGRRTTQRTDVAFVDKRDGRVIHKESFNGSASGYQILANPARRKKTVEFLSNVGAVKLTFTDEERPKDEKKEPLELTFAAAGAQANVPVLAPGLRPPVIRQPIGRPVPVPRIIIPKR